ncbi:MAG: hypothetical protein U9R74_19025, partial [Pseudomonadota bacterium]|nr:hypothetical protein [Pseudomonadota bacterium]
MLTRYSTAECSPSGARSGDVGRWWMPLCLVLSIALIMSSSGCGFRLRGQVSLPEPLSRTYIEGVPEYSEFATELRRTLRANGAEVMDVPEAAESVIRISSKRSGRRILAVNESGRALEYEFFVVVVFSVQGPDKKPLLAQQTVSVTRDFIFDE